MRERMGVFHISLELLEQNPEAVMKIMGRCVVIRAENLYYRNCIEYYAMSPDFEELGEGECAPEYTWIVDSLRGKVSARRSGLYKAEDINRMVTETVNASVTNALAELREWMQPKAAKKRLQRMSSMQPLTKIYLRRK